MRELNLQGKAHDNFGYTYPVSLQEKSVGLHRESTLTDWIFRIHNTPGSWFMSTLEKGDLRDALPIDMGQHWDCTNIKPLVAEAQELLKGIPRASASDW